MKKFLANTLYGLFILLLVGVASLFFAPLLPIKGNIEIKIVKSGSMEPAIKTGSIVVIKPASLYGVGDVITFGEDSRTTYPTTHRIVSKSEANGEILYQVKGDINEEPDPMSVRESDVIGKVIFTVPNAGYLLDFARQPVGFILLIAFPAALIILNEILDIGKEIRKVIRRKKKVSVEREKIFKRIYRMDDILRPVCLQAIKKKSNTPFIVSTITLFAATGFILANPGGTVSYFNDTEISVGNLLNAGSLDFSVALAPNESPNIKLIPGESAITIIPSVTGGSGDFLLAYKVRIEQIGGTSPALCNAIDLLASSTPFTYSNKLMMFSYGTTTSLGPLSLSLSLPSGSDFASTDTCLIDVVYSGWVDGKTEGIEYHDVERVSLSISDPPAGSTPVPEVVVPDIVSVMTELELELELESDEGSTTPEIISETAPDIVTETETEQEQSVEEIASTTEPVIEETVPKESETPVAPVVEADSTILPPVIEETPAVVEETPVVIETPTEPVPAEPAPVVEPTPSTE